MWEEKLNEPQESNLSTLSNHNFNDSEHFAVKWFGDRLYEVRNEVEILITQFRLSEALKTLYSLIWDDFCSWYLEWVKPEYGQAINKKVYETTVHYFDELLHLLHPFMPFITEEIYHLLKERERDLMIKQFSPLFIPDEANLKEGQKLKEIITAIRDARNKIHLKPKESISLHIETAEEAQYENFRAILLKQVNGESLVFNTIPEDPTITLVAGNEKIYVSCDLKIDKEAQREKLLKDLDYHKGFLMSVEKKLNNDKFINNAKPSIIDLEKSKKKDAEEKISLLENSLAALK
jgi:valyl-tRNA synthetase